MSIRCMNFKHNKQYFFVCSPYSYSKKDFKTTEKFKDV